MGVQVMPCPKAPAQEPHGGWNPAQATFTLNRGCVHFRKEIVLIASYFPDWGGRASYPEVTGMASRRTLDTAQMRRTALYRSHTLMARRGQHRVPRGVTWGCAQEQWSTDGCGRRLCSVKRTRCPLAPMGRCDGLI